MRKPRLIRRKDSMYRALVRDIVMAEGRGLSWYSSAVKKLETAAEGFLMQLFAEAKRCAEIEGRVTISLRDVQLAHRMFVSMQEHK